MSHYDELCRRSVAQDEPGRLPVVPAPIGCRTPAEERSELVAEIGSWHIGIIALLQHGWRRPNMGLLEAVERELRWRHELADMRGKLAKLRQRLAELSR